MKTIYYPFFVAILFSLGCCMPPHDDDDSVDMSDCGAFTIIGNDAYENESSAEFFPISATIDGDCLDVEISASGCDGNSWTAQLVDSGNIAESFPEQRYLRFVLNNQEICQAVFTRTFSFDLTPIQLEGRNSLILHLEGWEESLLYEF